MSPFAASAAAADQFLLEQSERKFVTDANFNLLLGSLAAESRRSIENEWIHGGCRHSSVDSSASTIVMPRVPVPSTPSILL